jgi:sulfur transfer protein SufE/stress-induced morphogen
MKAGTPFLIAGVPIAGLALQSWSANAWTPPVVVVPSSSSSSSSSSRSARVGGGSRRRKTTTTMSSSTDTTTDNIDVDSLHLTPQLKMMTSAFSSIPDERTRHKQLLHMASKLPDVDDSVRVPENKVPGCLSQVYVDCAATRRATTETDGGGGGGTGGEKWAVEYRGDSDGLLTKGLLALLVRGLSGCTPEEIEAVDPRFVRAARISQTLTPGRNNGFLNMLAVMKRKAREAVEREEEGGREESGESGGNVDDEVVAVAVDATAKTTTAAAAASDRAEEGGPMYKAILSALNSALNPKAIRLVDDSSKHAGHAGSRGWENGESHFSLEVVSEAFEGLNLVKRHKLIYATLGGVMPKIHALAIVARTPSEAE